MTLNTHDHDHKSVLDITWGKIGILLIELAEKIRLDYHPEIVVGIAKGGMIPAVFLSSAFLVDFLPIKLSSRKNEEIVYDEPIWHVLPTDLVKNKSVLLVDDICISKKTLNMASEEIYEMGAKDIKTVSIAIHNESNKPDFYILNTDDLIVWPWDRDTLNKEGKWAINNEYLDEMKNIESYEPKPSPLGK